MDDFGITGSFSEKISYLKNRNYIDELIITSTLYRYRSIKPFYANQNENISLFS